MIFVFIIYFMPGTMVSIFHMLWIYHLTSLKKEKKNEEGIIPFFQMRK